MKITQRLTILVHLILGQHNEHPTEKIYFCKNICYNILSSLNTQKLYTFLPNIYRHRKQKILHTEFIRNLVKHSLFSKK